VCSAEREREREKDFSFMTRRQAGTKLRHTKPVGVVVGKLKKGRKRSGKVIAVIISTD
jgi:hypothetical protein